MLPSLLVAGVNMSLFAAMSLTRITSLTATGLLFSVYTPSLANGKLVTLTLLNTFAGVSFRSLNPKSATVMVYAVFSLMVMVLSLPWGASLTGVTVMVSVEVSFVPEPSVSVYVMTGIAPL